jgi:hypothetical protein
MATIKILNQRKEEFDLVSGEFQQLVNTLSISGKKEHQKLPSSSYIYTQQINKLDERTLTFKAKIEKGFDFEKFRTFILEDNMEFYINVIDGTQGNEQIYCFGVLTEHTRDRIEVINLHNFELKFLMTSRFFKEKSYEFDANLPSFDGTPYDLDYTQGDNSDGYIYANETGDFSNGILTVFNNGDRPANVRVRYEGVTTNLKTSVVDNYNNTLNAFGLENFSSNVGDIITLNGFDRNLSITYDNNVTITNIEQERDFSKLTWMKIPIGESRVLFQSVTKAFVFVIQEYNDIPNIYDGKTL